MHAPNTVPSQRTVSSDVHDLALIQAVGWTEKDQGHGSGAQRPSGRSGMVLVDPESQTQRHGTASIVCLE